MRSFPGKFIYYPIFVFAVLFSLDRVCLHPEIKLLSQGDATYLYFDYKNELMDQMEAIVRENRLRPASSRKKIVVILGSSRLLYFDYARFARNFPDWELFNFSAPVTAPAYYTYIVKSLIDRGIAPDYLLVESDPFQYNDGSGAFVRSNLAYSFSLPFILSNADLFSGEEISSFLARTSFAAYKYPPRIGIMFKRFRNPNDQHLLAFRDVDAFQRRNRGAGKSLIPRENWFETDFARLEMTSRTTIDWLYGNYAISERQFEFLSRMTHMVEESGIRLIFVRPPVSRPMTVMLNGDENIRRGLLDWERRFSEFVREGGHRYLDFTREDSRFYCNTYADASHMSLDCYHPFMVEVMRNFLEMRPPAGSPGSSPLSPDS
jgi:hypothetical protein